MNQKKKFAQGLKDYVYTTRFVIEDKSPIILVSHDEDGDWQFLSEEGPVESEARVILLGEMIQHDPSILEIADLALGAKAFRDNADCPWRIRKNSVSNN
jgi:hypothetical protein